MTRHPGLIRAARRRVDGSVLLPFLGGNLLLALAAVLALLIPDSHTWQLFLSLLLILGLISGLLLWNATVIRRLRRPAEPVPLWLSALLLGACVLIALGLFHVAGLAEPDIDTRAGYWNSQFTSGMRHLLPYSRLVQLQEGAIRAFQWMIVPAIFVPFAIEISSSGWKGPSLHRAVRVVLSPRHWLVALVAFGAAAWFAPVLTVWHPSHTVPGEIVSAMLRLSLAGILLVCAVLLLFTVDAELLHRRAAAATVPSA